MVYRLRLPGAIYRQARDRAGSDKELHGRLVQYVTEYATGTTGPARAARALAESMTPEQRRERASLAARERWAKAKAG